MDQLPNEPIGVNEPPPPPGDDSTPAWLRRKEYTDPAEMKRDFWRGFGLWWLLNIVLTLFQWAVFAAFTAVASAGNVTDEIYSTVYGIFSLIIYILPWVVNIGLMIYLAFTRSQMALGMLAGFGSALALAICLGVIATAACMIIFSTMGY